MVISSIRQVNRKNLYRRLSKLEHSALDLHRPLANYKTTINLMFIDPCIVI